MLRELKMHMAFRAPGFLADFNFPEKLVPSYERTLLVTSIMGLWQAFSILILVAVFGGLLLAQLQRWFQRYLTQESDPGASLECASESAASGAGGETEAAGSARAFSAGAGVAPAVREDDAAFSNDEVYDEDGLLGGLWNLNSALHFGQDYEWIYKLSEANLELGDAGLASLCAQASSLLGELYATVLLKYSQFTAADECAAGECGGRGEDDEDESFRNPCCCGSATCICFTADSCDGMHNNLPTRRRTARQQIQSGERVENEDEEIASIEADEVNPNVEWGLRKKDLIAEENRRLDLSHGFSFSAAGLLFPYYLGVAHCLKEYNLLTEDTPLAGSSAGALVCAVVAGGVNMRDSLEATKELGRECREGGTAFKLGAVLRRFLDRFLPVDAHLRANGRIRVSITQVFGSPKGLLVDQFDSKEDLLDALLASCHIPLYFASWPVTLFRNRICLDGGIAFFAPPTSANHTVRVCPFPGLGVCTYGISPDCNPSLKRPSLFQLVRWMLVPAEDHHMEELFDLGYRDALVWCRKHPACIKDSTQPKEKKQQ